MKCHPTLPPRFVMQSADMAAWCIWYYAIISIVMALEKCFVLLSENKLIQFLITVERIIVAANVSPLRFSETITHFALLSDSVHGLLCFLKVSVNALNC